MKSHAGEGAGETWQNGRYQYSYSSIVSEQSLTKWLKLGCSLNFLANVGFERTRKARSMCSSYNNAGATREQKKASRLLFQHLPEVDVEIKAVEQAVNVAGNSHLRSMI